MKMDFLKHIDFFGEKVKIYINKKEAVPTSIGGFFTITLIALLTTAAWVIGNDIFYRKSPFSYQESLIAQFYPAMNMTRQNFPFGLVVTDWDGAPVQDDRIFVLELTHYEYKTYDNGSYYVANETNIELEPCEFKHFPNITEKQFIKSDLGFYQCLKVDSLELVGYWAENHFKYLEIRLSMCYRTNDCLPIEDIAGYIKSKRLNLNFIYLEPFLENTNFDDPLQHAVSVKYIFAQTLISKAMSFGLDQNYLNTDYGLIINDFQTKDFLKLGVVTPADPVDIDDETRALITFEIYSSNKYTNLFRIYIKIPDVVASVGGLMGIGQVIFGYMNLLFSRLNRNLLTINKVFNLDNPTNNDKLDMSIVKGKKYKKTSQQLDIKELKYEYDESMKRYIHVRGSMDSEILPYNKKAENIKKLFKQRTTLNFNIKESLVMLFCRRCEFKFSEGLRDKIIKYERGVNFVKIYYDLINIIKRLEELELLKKVLFTDNQLRLFDVLRKLKTNEQMDDEKLELLDQDLKNIWEMNDKSIVDENLYCLLDF
jgi:hypothetical protein